MAGVPIASLARLATERNDACALAALRVHARDSAVGATSDGDGDADAEEASLVAAAGAVAGAGADPNPPSHPRSSADGAFARLPIGAAQSESTSAAAPPSKSSPSAAEAAPSAPVPAIEGGPVLVGHPVDHGALRIRAPLRLVDVQTCMRLPSRISVPIYWLEDAQGVRFPTTMDVMHQLMRAEPVIAGAPGAPNREYEVRVQSESDHAGFSVEALRDAVAYFTGPPTVAVAASPTTAAAPATTAAASSVSASANCTH